MGSAWDYSAKERSADGKFSAEFDGLNLAVARRVLASYGFTRARRHGVKFEAQRKR